LQASFQRFGVGAERTSRSDISDREFHLFDGGDRLFEWIATRRDQWGIGQIIRAPTD
jgi:hypothetical protein